jgi:hypothetical protein
MNRDSITVLTYANNPARTRIRIADPITIQKSTIPCLILCLLIDLIQNRHVLVILKRDSARTHDHTPLWSPDRYRVHATRTMPRDGVRPPSANGEVACPSTELSFPGRGKPTTFQYHKISAALTRIDTLPELPHSSFLVTPFVTRHQ